MKHKQPSPIIRTDKWTLNPTAEQRHLFSETVKVYRRLCRYLVGIIFTHWPELGGLSSNEQIPAVERLMHSTGKRPVVKYPQFNRVFYKFPSYYRRAAISFAIGQVNSYMTRYVDWQTGLSRNRRDAKPHKLNADAGCYPVLYKGQCYKLHDYNAVEIKVFTGADWIWTTVQISGLRERHKLPDNKMLSPTLIFNSQVCHLSVPFHCVPPKQNPEQNVVAVDLGINTTATVTVVTFDGTVIHREFLNTGRDIDRRDKRLKSVSMRASKTMGKGGKLHKGFCSKTYQKCANINKQISHIVSKRIVQIASQFNSEAIVFENLKGWTPKGGRKRSNLRQRFHGWLKAKIRDYTEMKWQEKGGKVIDVVAAYTSKLAYDGSGRVKRDSKNYALAVFQNGRQYNCDLNGSQNIAARGILKLTRRNDSEDLSSKRSGGSPRSWACLCDLWTHESLRLA
ncbi:IS200/IS605 family accessory protein TnpB-related protein [Laspinema olomoucense]|uniref:IS200/IS605 family accessory protein TnpB-related protein n=1 Tax=Laspinema olomoucense TaxID=3231600 RepID=UPI0021BB3F78|nr:IS200/IS605 family accessory protein TnpB-related protein [Laspinema sp. D3c]MCT7992424.1 IS200/IS605 family accessory protein TnpB-related protein [Laspinema sp. D3c]